MSEITTRITDLPLDILVLVFPYLDAKSFLALCNTCRAFQQPSIRLDPAYWSHATRSAFRVPNQPVVQHDGVRWQKMYKRLLTQSRVFTWGSNTYNRLGHRREEQPRHNPTMPRMPRFRPARFGGGTSCAVPTEMDNTQELGVIADMQCGGWSTTLLTSKGSLHSVGVLDGQKILVGNERITTLKFPEGYPTSSIEAQYKEPTIAIRQFSAGRSHILALSDSGRIWSWYHAKEPALQVKFANVELKETPLADSGSHSSTYGRVKQVVAGWSRSSAYIYGIGIVVWDPVERRQNDQGTDTILLMENAEVPRTGYQRPRGAQRESDDAKALGEEVGAVLNYVILEHFVVFVTDIGKVFCGRFGEKHMVDDIVELRAFRSENQTPSDVQGSFRRFAIFKDGEVITSDQDYLEACWNAQRANPEQTDIQGLRKIPALQHNGVISVAFGDYHYLALHSSGRITSYGSEMQVCGALGLGSLTSGELRGVTIDRLDQTGRLTAHAYTHGRQVWFDDKKRKWFAIDHVVDQDESKERWDLFKTDPNVQGEVSEWFEQEGRLWDKDGGDDGLGAYFALGVSAAGWHSGALVLVNEDLAEKQFAAHLKSTQSEGMIFPRLKLSDGREMPGSKDFDEWREGRPDWQLDAER
ncbi:RCC1/BLIP-II [Dothidotthia symphoricarpi CBS 119687]|uniref:RCC1/BLIP-II n=1 Tax=Dothidotthia symphoricarpi CBS 119687 TaxID=1392245 RepID=A0A6A6A6V1_9PLEO|nr:RCC1/BLIP-II [Dothidotthia symphoricarpi CBS 119687]KAF2126351.1 RCC1/BLIP-II [Dothidotthia symphoricarpi CBS 119687]